MNGISHTRFGILSIDRGLLFPGKRLAVAFNYETFLFSVMKFSPDNPDKWRILVPLNINLIINTFH